MKYTTFFKRYNNLLLFILVLILSTTACIKESIITDVSTIVNEPQQLIKATLYGRVIDENDLPITGATITYKSGEQWQTLTTDNEGYFLWRDVQNKGKSAYLSVEHPGMFGAFRRMSLLENRFNYTEIKMNPKNIIGQINANDGGTLSHSSSAQITLPAQGIVQENGNLYEGNVAVAMAWIDPSAIDLPQRMVGDLSGIDEDGIKRSLSTFGMLQVELLDDNGNELNIAEGNTATLVFPVPSAMQNAAPQTIPLWSYNEEQGTWIQEGEAYYDNGEYTGTVTHFSSWNVDFFNDPIEITGAVKWSTMGDSLVNTGYLMLYVCSDVIGQKGGWLTNDGTFLFYNFPKNEVFDLKIVDRCGETIYQESYGPYTENTDLGTITVTPDTNYGLASGNAIDCDGNAISDGYVVVSYENLNQLFPLNSDGSFNFTTILCTAETAEVSVVNSVDALISSTYTVDNTTTVWTFDNVEVCDELTDFIGVSINGAPIEIYTPNINFSAELDSFNYVTYAVETPDSYIGISLYFDGTITEGVPLNVWNFNYVLYSNMDNSFEYIADEIGITIIFTTYNNVAGGEVEGTFSGSVIDTATGDSVLITGSFHVSIE